MGLDHPGRVPAPGAALTGAGPGAKVLSRAEAVRRAGPGRSFRLVFTNGCFDLLHRGHVECLVRARALGDALMVAINTDESVRRLGKGPGRPLVAEEDRAMVLGALECVDWVTSFHEDTPEALVAELEPDVLVKGGDYTEDEVAGAATVRDRGGRVVIVPHVAGYSTSGLVRRLRDRPVKLLLATRSAHKAAEVARILETAPAGGYRLVTLEDESVPRSAAEESLEPFESFEENAASKAGYFADLTGLPTVADDSGLEVAALDGRPGVRTKRFAPLERYVGLERDDANNSHLLECLRGLPPAERGARYVCVACYVDPRSGDTVHFRGEAPGRIVTRPRGKGGFGYDPLFLDVDTGRTYAELTADQKHQRSHRGCAFRALAAYLRS